MMTRLGLGLSGSGMTPPEVVECVRLADELGYDSAWLSEGHGGDQFSTLTACALATERIKLGTSISSVFVRSAPTIAMAAACVDHFSGGRFILGLGSSHRVQVEGEHGLDYSRPVRRLRESVEIIRTLLREGEARYKGEVLDIQRFDIWFKPLRQEIPIYLAAVFPKMLRICGELAQGTMLTWTTVDGARKAAEMVAEGAREAGRHPEDIDVASLISTSVSMEGLAGPDDLRMSLGYYAGFFPRYNRQLAKSGFPEEAAAIRRAYRDGRRGEELAKLVPDHVLSAVAVIGTPDQCKERLAEYRQAGLTLPITTPRETSKEQVIEVIRALAP
ncbi:MAG: LLM class flavin-dependent oxidoreductase [Dehalococcoidia bacterium]